MPGTTLVEVLHALSIILFNNIYFLGFYFYFILFEGERAQVRASGGGQRKRKRENPKQPPRSELSTEADTGLDLMNREIMT